jgi:hypothetical protein
MEDLLDGESSGYQMAANSIRVMAMKASFEYEAVASRS